MQIPNLGANQTPETRGHPIGASAAAGAGKRSPGEAGDHYQSSAAKAFASELVARLKDDADKVRPEVVQKYRRLLRAGELDTPEAIAKAARGLLGEAD